MTQEIVLIMQVYLGTKREEGKRHQLFRIITACLEAEPLDDDESKMVGHLLPTNENRKI